MIGLYSWTWWALGQGGFLRVWRQFHAKGLLQPYEAQRILNQYAVAFLRLHLKGDQRAAAALTAAYAAEHEPAVELVERPAAALSR